MTRTVFGRTTTVVLLYVLAVRSEADLFRQTAHQVYPIKSDDYSFKFEPVKMLNYRAKPLQPQYLTGRQSSNVFSRTPFPSFLATSVPVAPLHNLLGNFPSAPMALSNMATALFLNQNGVGGSPNAQTPEAGELINIELAHRAALSNTRRATYFDRFDDHVLGFPSTTTTTTGPPVLLTETIISAAVPMMLVTAPNDSNILEPTFARAPTLLDLLVDRIQNGAIVTPTEVGSDTRPTMSVDHNGAAPRTVSLLDLLRMRVMVGNLTATDRQLKHFHAADDTTNSSSLAGLMLLVGPANKQPNVGGNLTSFPRVIRNFLPTSNSQARKVSRGEEAMLSAAAMLQTAQLLITAAFSMLAQHPITLANTSNTPGTG